ncbi:MAG: prolipoprotein diacylglyceryl transferase [Clostridia bacterium]|nr:prolipoprotein diacylglyceryl transferase [Clostridia bacterium]
MNLQYVLWFLGSLVLSLGLFALMNRGKKGVLPQCLLMGALGTVFGVVLAKLVYYLAMINYMMMYGWLQSLVDVTMGTFSYYGGVAGFCLGVVLTARLTHEKPMALLDAFAPAGVLLAALARFGEFLLEGVGTRDFLYWELPEHCFFPLAVSNEYGEWLYAVFMLEGLLTLCVFVLCVTCFRQQRFLRALFYLCLLQILCESLRTDSFTWLFVKVEQLICMLGLAGVVLVYCIKTPVRGVRRWLPILYCFPVAAVFVVLEFALNGKIPMGKPLCYAIMIAGLVLLSLNEIRAFRRMEATK